MTCQNCPNGKFPEPSSYCTYAVQNLKARNPADLKDFEKLPGCAWAVRDQESGYCFFNYIRINAEEHSVLKIALLLEIPENLVKELLESSHAIIKEYVKQ